MDFETNNTKQYSLSELAGLVQGALSFISDNTYWVRAEIASVSSRSGHGYFELVERTDNGLAAKMRATCWSNIYAMLSAYFAEQTGKTLQTGMQVLVEVEINFHSVYGLSLNIRNIDPRFTLGEMARQRQMTINRLQAEGAFELQQQHILPTAIQRIAVISAQEAAGWGDFADQLRQSGDKFTTKLFPAIMQGERAEKSILQALDTIAAEKDNFDVVVIIRGGGATTDLSCFDSYEIAKACALFPLPILTGIGHTRDVSILDMVAYMPLKTPTAVAAFFVSRIDSLIERVTRIRQRLKQVGEKQIMLRRHKIELLRQRLTSCSPERIYRLGYSLVTIDGQAVRSVEDLQRGQKIVTHFIDGKATAIVEETQSAN